VSTLLTGALVERRRVNDSAVRERRMLARAAAGAAHIDDVRRMAA